MGQDGASDRLAHQSGGAAVLFIAILSSLFWGSAAEANEPAENSKPPAPVAGTPLNTIVAIGLPAVWERGTSILDGIGLGARRDCVPFQLQLVGPLPKSLEITTSGIADAVLVQSPNSTPCNTAAGKHAVQIGSPTSTPIDLELIAPAEAFPDLTAGSKGQVVAIADGKALGPVGVTLRRRGLPIVWQTPLWFLSIGIPALVTAWIGFEFTRRQRQLDIDKQESANLIAFYKAHAQGVRDFFSGLYRNIIEEDSKNAPEDMRRELIERGIFAALPGKDSVEVAKALNMRDWHRLSKVLALSFGDCKSLILGEAID